MELSNSDFQFPIFDDHHKNFVSVAKWIFNNVVLKFFDTKFQKYIGSKKFPSNEWQQVNLQKYCFVVFRLNIPKLYFGQRKLFKCLYWFAINYKFIANNTFTCTITYVALVLGLISGSSSSFSDSSSKSNMASNFIPSNSNSPEDKLYVFVWLI